MTHSILTLVVDDLEELHKLFWQTAPQSPMKLPQTHLDPNPIIATPVVPEM